MAPLAARDVLALAALFVLHWAAIAFFCTYAFVVRPRRGGGVQGSRGDAAFVGLFAALLLHWVLLGDCAVSWAEKRILYGDAAQAPPFSNPSVQLYQGSNPWTLALLTALPVLYLVNVSVVLRRMGAPWAAIALLAAFVAVYIGRIRVREYEYIRSTSRVYRSL